MSHTRIADLGWTPSYVQQAKMTFPTDYKIKKSRARPDEAGLRSYFPMQEEKDNRVYGAAGCSRCVATCPQCGASWVEWMKLSVHSFPRFLRTLNGDGWSAGTGEELPLVSRCRWWMSSATPDSDEPEEVVYGEYIDPAGRHHRSRVRRCYATTIGRQFAEGSSPATHHAANVYLQVVARNSVHNTLFVRASEAAPERRLRAAHRLPVGPRATESRHIGTANSLLMSLINDPDITCCSNAT